MKRSFFFGLFVCFCFLFQIYSCFFFLLFSHTFVGFFHLGEGGLMFFGSNRVSDTLLLSFFSFSAVPLALTCVFFFLACKKKNLL